METRRVSEEIRPSASPFAFSTLNTTMIRSIHRSCIAALWLALYSVFLPDFGLCQGNQPATNTPIRSQYDVTYRSIDGVNLQADVFWPKKDEKHPAVLLIHGGAWSSGDKWHMRDHARQLAQAGYVAATINYRLAPRHKIESQIEDCRAALKWLASQYDYNVDSDRLGIWGYSAGAHLACLISYRKQEDEPTIGATIAGGTPCDFSNLPEDSQVLALVMGGSPREKPQLYHDIAPINFVSATCPPTFFFHGTKDFIVPPKGSRDMEQKLRECGVNTDYHAVEEQGHLVTFIDAAAKLKAIEFLNKHLKPDR
jgi:acetyl esterase/lipase